MRPGITFIVCGLAFAISAHSFPSAKQPPTHRRPNVIVILADDLGYGDVSCNNKESKIATPHLDRLAAQGMRFTDAHTPSAVCTPTRYGLLTGRYAWRTRLKQGVLDGFDPPLIEAGRQTVADFLRAQGYATAAVGKWHLGMNWTTKDGQGVAQRDPSRGFRPGYEVDFTRELTGGPLDHGFDKYFGISASLDMSPYCFIEGRRSVGSPGELMSERKDLFLNQVPGVTAPGFTLEGVLPALTRRAVEFIEARDQQPRRPFFLYLPLTSPHLPVVPNKEWRGKSGAGDYGDFVMETDATVGAVLDALDRAKLADNTLIVFTSDNGGLWHGWDAKEADDLAAYKPTARAKYARERGHQGNAHLRGTKADIWEGGHRVPFLVRWPGKVKAGTTSAALVELNDVLATLAEITGQPLPAQAAEDSFSFLPALSGKRAPRTFAVHHSINGLFALREGRWKFAAARGSGGFSAPRTVTPAAGEVEGQLYDLIADPSETRNVWREHPEIVTRLQARLDRIRGGNSTREGNR